MESRRFLINPASIDPEFVKLIAAGMGPSIERPAPPALPAPDPIGDKVRKLAGRKSDKRGVKACGCGRPISANATQCAKCAGLVDKVAGFVG